MKNNLKVMTIVGTRPEIIRLSEVIKACEKYFDHILVHTGQNWDYNLSEVFFKDFNLKKPDHFLNSPGKNLGETIGNILALSYTLLAEISPDALLILGDTNSALSAIMAKRLKIPVFHMEAGNRCFDQNVPEEINRKIVDHISDINMPYTEHSRRYLIAEGFRKEHIFVTGSPMKEVLHKNREKIESSGIQKTLEVEKKKYIVVSMHREENLDINHKFNSLVQALNRVAEEYGLPMLFSTHPRTFKKLHEKRINFHENIKNIQPLGFFDYVKLQKDSFCVLSDSGTLSEESAILNFPGVLIRSSTERPEVLDKGTVVIGGYTEESITQSVEIAVKSQEEVSQFSNPPDYEDKNVSMKVVKIIQSYTDIINKLVWNKVV